MKNCIVKVTDTFLTGLQCISLNIRVVQSAFEPLGTKTAFELIRFDIILA